MSLRSV